MSVPALVKQLRAASAAYYNGGKPLLDDDAYDALVEQLRSLDPENPYLEEIGAPPQEGSVRLPYPMPSLDKIKPGQDQLTRFLANTTGFVVTEKLDGLSALWVGSSKKLYLRGDGLVGQDISHLAPLGIQGLATGNASVRGELILPRAAGEKLARSWVNGLVHRKEPAAADVAKVHFVAYEVLAPVNLTRGEQLAFLKKAGFEVPWTMVAKQLTVETLAEGLKKRRSDSPYDTDGLVVGLMGVPKSESTVDRVRNPKDCVAFKMPLDEQAAETTVREVIWGASAQGYLIPKLQFDPVHIGSATIQFCTAHNARVVADGKLGAGARILVRRSGDVIPKLDRVLAPASAASMPAEGTYEWDSTQTHIRVTSGTTSTAVVAAKLGHFLKTLEIPGSGPATVAALVKGGITGPSSLWAASAERLSELLGPKTGASLHVNLRKALDGASEMTLMVASSQMPRGVGETKLKALFEHNKDPRQWRVGTGCTAPTGWTMMTLTPFWDTLKTYEDWRKKELGWIPYPKGAGVTVEVAKPAVASKGVLCMTGFRDKVLEEKATAAGYSFAPTFTAKVTHLLVPDGEVKDSEKVKAARSKGIPIVGRTAFVTQYLG
jgi:NAD-dependent DNA ligase